MLPGATGSIESDLLIERSAKFGAFTSVVAVAELFPGTGSAVLELTVAVLLICVPAGPFADATRVIVSEAPPAMDAKFIVRLFPPPALHVPPGALHDTKVTLPGKLSVTRTEFAAAGP